MPSHDLPPKVSFFNRMPVNHEIKFWAKYFNKQNKIYIKVYIFLFLFVKIESI